MKIEHLRTEYLRNPLGIDIDHPRFTWTLDGIKKQKKAEVLYRVNNGEEKSIPIDCDRMEASYPEEKRGRDFITWKVKVYDEEGNTAESEEAFFSFLPFQNDFSAHWIRGDYHVSKKKRYPVDCFYKEFLLDSVEKSFLYISALGLYEVYLNERKVSDHILTPGSTDYRVRTQMNTYDVTSYLRPGKNTIHVLLADGWYRGSIGAKGFTYVFGKETKVFFQLECGKKKIISDRNTYWDNHAPIVFADLKDGENVDMNLIPSFHRFARETDYTGLLSASDSVPVIEEAPTDPIRIWKEDGYTTYQFVRNTAGYLSIEADCKKGDSIDVVLGELMDEKNEVTLKNVQCIRKGKKTPLQEIHIRCKEGENCYHTRFFYGGFRYATVRISKSVRNLRIHQIAIHSDIEDTSTFACANDLINIFYQNTINSMKSNSVDIPTDCPTRERMGWTGDSQVFFPTASYLSDYAAFSRKHLRDVFDRQKKNGCLPQIAPYSAEDWFMNVMNGSVGWADVGVLTPYRMYLKYGDKRILSDNYDRMMKYARFMIKRTGRAKGLYALYAKPLHLSKENRKYGINTGQSYGEWAEPVDVKAFVWTDFAMPHPEESMAYTVYVLSTMVKISEILDRRENLPLLIEYRDGVKHAYQELVTKEAYTLDTDRQAKLVRPLKMHLLTDDQEAFAKKRLIEALDHYHWRLGTGFLSTPFILDVLQDIDPKYAYRLLLNEEMPGWLYMAKNNTGTIWEGWEGEHSEKGIASLNHYSKGAMVGWLFSGMLGIKVDGIRHFLVCPVVDRRVPWAKGSYVSHYGKIISEWEIRDDMVFFRVTVPSNCEADFSFEGNNRHLVAGDCTFSYPFAA